MSDTPGRLRIAFLTAMTLQDKRSSWRITNRYMTQALQTYCGDVIDIGPIDIKELVVGKLVNRSAQLLFKKGFMYYHSFYFSKRYAHMLSRKLTGQSFDVIFGPSCATEAAFLETDIPIVLTEDANIASLLDYYTQFSHLLPRSSYEANKLEEMGVRRAELVLHPSEWAAQITCEHYQVGRDKVHVVPYGTNIDHPPPAEIAQRRTKSGRCKLLFIGVDWERKGGAIAFETLLEIEKLGIQAELTICGCVPPGEFQHEHLRVIPFLDRKIESQGREMEQLFETSDFLFLPTRSEAYGMVFCEASSFGLPSITTNTGGVSGAVTDGINGYLLPLEARGTQYAELIARVYRDDEGYTALVRSSREEYERRLTWDAWGKAVSVLIFKMMKRKQQANETPLVSSETM